MQVFLKNQKPKYPRCHIKNKADTAKYKNREVAEHSRSVWFIEKIIITNKQQCGYNPPYIFSGEKTRYRLKTNRSGIRVEKECRKKQDY